jgi:hypothetical protein
VQVVQLSTLHKKIGILILIADFYFRFFGIGLFKVWLQGGGKIK